MKTGKRELGPASCTVRFSKVIDGARRGKLREITDMQVEPGAERNGYASKLLDSLTQEADASGVALMVTVEPFGKGLDKKALSQWYYRHGFLAIQDDPLVMVR